MTHWAMPIDSVDALATGMNSAGGSRPRVPTDQRLGADQAAIPQAHLRLIEQLELAALHGQPQLRLQHQPRLEGCPHAAIEKHMPAAPGGLGAIQSEVGIAEQLLGAGAIARIDRQPDADLDVDLPGTDRERRVERAQRALRQLLRAVLDFGAADHDRELIAAQAGHKAGPRERGAQMAGDGAEHLIAAGMAERIVDLLELVDVDHQQRHLALLRGGGGEPGGQILVQRIAIGEPGQGVVLGEIADSLRFALAHRDVPQHRPILEAVGARPAEDLQREGLAVASATRELHHHAAWRLQVFLRQV
jgi:hypothetical protein